MVTSQNLRIAALAGPPAILVVAGTIWLWLRFGMGVYFDAAMGALAGCM